MVQQGLCFTLGGSAPDNARHHMSTEPAPGLQADHPGSGQQSSPAPAIDVAALAQLQQLDPGGSSGIVKRVLQTYQRSLERFLQDVQSARANADHDALGRLAHTLRSSSASVGALGVSHLCQLIETQVREQHEAALPVLLDALALESVRVQTALAAMLGDFDHGSSTTK